MKKFMRWWRGRFNTEARAKQSIFAFVYFLLALGFLMLMKAISLGLPIF